MSHRTLDDLELRGKRVLVRVDLNVPVKDGRVTDDTRIRASLPTLREIMDKGGRPILLAHFGRPKGKREAGMSLKVVVPALEAALGVPVRFAQDCIGEAAEQAARDLPAGEVLLLENTRFHAGEEANDPGFADALARLGEAYVNDAFSAAHRAHASTEGLAHRLPAASGRLMEAEIHALERALERPERPLVAVVGGAKVSTKIELLSNLTAKCDQLIIGGGMANTFLAAQGAEIGRSLAEPDLSGTAREVMARGEAAGCELVLPRDVVVAHALAEGVASQVVAAHACPPEEMILDIGPDSLADVEARFRAARTVLWNGPLGAFETPPFDRATLATARTAAELTRAGRLVTVAGGGDTVAALNAAGVAGDFSFVSTAGGAFLEWLEGKTLPGVAALEHR